MSGLMTCAGVGPLAYPPRQHEGPLGHSVGPRVGVLGGQSRTRGTEECDAQPASVDTGLPFRVMDVHRVANPILLPGDTELDSFVHPSWGADGDSHFLTAPEVPLLEENMRNMTMITGVITNPWTRPMARCVAWTCSPRRTAT